MVRFVFPALLLLLVPDAWAQAPSRVDVIALRVEFQPDTTRFTTGDGTFDGVLFEGVDAPSIDPLPHDQAYFEAHLNFLENYVRAVSDRKTQVVSYVLPQVVRVSKTMGAYSPTGLDAGSDAELSKLASLVEEAWTLADQSGMSLPAGLDPATTAFVVFHAGVGRDIELVGTTLNKTPEDLPSIFFDEPALDRLGVSGIVMDGMPVTSTMIIPRTESRLGVDPLTSEPFLIELSTNGLIAASFFNYLGVPDLFNTETGDSAIGPFGLMDALGIFAYSGLFPPEPSAWTKQFLGWAIVQHHQPWVVEPTEYTLENRGLFYGNDMVRVIISDDEYFLVENRARDNDGNGIKLRIWTPEGTQDVFYENGNPEFNDQTVSGFPGGVVIDVDDYDFALPGGLDENGNALLGGILIWHVDERRLLAGLDENAVNADPNARAIDLEEADGAQDIGFNSSSGLFGPRFDLGTPFDFWFEGNPVTVRTSSGQDIRLYSNRFAPDTIPASTNNLGGQTGWVLNDFSPVGPTMSFTVQRSNAGYLEPIHQFGFTAPWVSENTDHGVLLGSPGSERVWSWREGQWVTHSWLCFGSTAQIQPFALDDNLFFVEGDSLKMVTGADCVGDTLTSLSSSGRTWTTPGLEWTRFPEELRLYAGFEDQAGPALMTVVIHADGRVEEFRRDLQERANMIHVTSRESGSVFIVSDTGIRNGQGQLLVDARLSDVGSSSMAGSATGWSFVWTSNNTSEISVLSSDGSTSAFAPYPQCIPDHVAFRDMDADGKPEISFTCGKLIGAIHLSGAYVPEFPIELDEEATGRPVFAVDTSNQDMVLAVSSKGHLEGWYRDFAGWTRIDGMPVAGDAAIYSAPLLIDDRLLVLPERGTVPQWRFPIAEATYAGDIGLFTQLSAQDAPDPESARLLVASETYNWPNPIDAGSTRIRFEVQETSAVEIDIVDMSGQLIDQLEVASAAAGVPTEVIWQTEAGSGIYLARVKATALSGGETDTRLIRMAIIR